MATFALTDRERRRTTKRRRLVPTITPELDTALMVRERGDPWRDVAILFFAVGGETSDAQVCLPLSDRRQGLVARLRHDDAMLPISTCDHRRAAY